MYGGGPELGTDGERGVPRGLPGRRLLPATSAGAPPAPASTAPPAGRGPAAPRRGPTRACMWRARAIARCTAVRLVLQQRLVHAAPVGEIRGQAQRREGHRGAAIVEGAEKVTLPAVHLVDNGNAELFLYLLPPCGRPPGSPAGKRCPGPVWEFTMIGTQARRALRYCSSKLRACSAASAPAVHCWPISASPSSCQQPLQLLLLRGIRRHPHLDAVEPRFLCHGEIFPERSSPASPTARISRLSSCTEDSEKNGGRVQRSAATKLQPGRTGVTVHTSRKRKQDRHSLSVAVCHIRLCAWTLPRGHYYPLEREKVKQLI